MFTEITPIRQSQVLRAVIVTCFIVFAAVVRILPHPWIFTPVGAMALSSAAQSLAESRKHSSYLYPHCCSAICMSVSTGSCLLSTSAFASAW